SAHCLAAAAAEAAHFRALSPFPTRRSSDLVLNEAEDRLAKWRAAAAEENKPQRVAEVLATVTGHLANDLDTPSVLPTHRACAARDRKSTRLNSSHVSTSYAGFSLQKKLPTE